MAEIQNKVINNTVALPRNEENSLLILIYCRNVYGRMMHSFCHQNTLQGCCIYQIHDNFGNRKVECRIALRRC